VVVAITGGIAEGKSTVLGILANLGFSTLSADLLAKEVFNDPEVNRSLASLLDIPFPVAPSDILNAISNRSGARRAVNRIMHPRILAGIQQSEAEFVEIPLLIEACLQGNFDRTWLVTCGRDEQRRRLRERYGDSFDFEALLAAQLTFSVKMVFADEVIRTNFPLETVRRNVSEALARRFECG